MSRIKKKVRLLDRALVLEALSLSARRLGPQHQWRNPVIFVVYIGSLATTLLGLREFAASHASQAGYVLHVSGWLWATVLFANFAEALAEGRGKAQARALRESKRDLAARVLEEPRRGASSRSMNASELRAGQFLQVEAGEVIPADGEVVEGMASVDESAITGESAPVIRESGGDRSSVTGGTKVLSDWIVVRVTAEPGHSFLDRMISMVEGAKRAKTPNEVALDMLLASFTIVFLLACATLIPFSVYASAASGQGAPLDLTTAIALLVCLIPTTIGGLLSAIRIAGMDRLMQANVVATSGRAVEAAGDVDVLLLDKTGTITHGNRQATGFYAAPGVSEAQLAEAAHLASAADETPEGRSIVALATERLGRASALPPAASTSFHAFSAHTRMSGVDVALGGEKRALRKGAVDALEAYLVALGGRLPEEVRSSASQIASRGATPLVVGDGARALGVIELKDVVKSGIRERFGELRRMGIKTVMVTGDNPLTAASIAAEAGVDDFIAQATPETKLKRIREFQAGGRLVAMTGDGTNDAPALAQADVAVAMNSGTQAAKEAGNMVDLDSSPTKLLDIVHIGKQLLMTRGALTTFSLANDMAKYFAILPAVFVPMYPALIRLDVMHLSSPRGAVLSAVAFNALILPLLVPLSMRGVRYRPVSAGNLLARNLLLYGLGGVVTPFLGIKLVDICLSAMGLS